MARAELLKLAVQKIVEETLEAEVAAAVGRDYYENGAAPGAEYQNAYRRGRLRTAQEPHLSTASPRSRIGASRSSLGCAPIWRAGRRSWSDWR